MSAESQLVSVRISCSCIHTSTCTTSRSLETRAHTRFPYCYVKSANLEKTPKLIKFVVNQIWGDLKKNPFIQYVSLLVKGVESINPEDVKCATAEASLLFQLSGNRAHSCNTVSSS